MTFMKHMKTGHKFLGYTERQGTFSLTQAGKQNYQSLCILHIAACGLHMAGCLGARLSYGEHQLPGMACFEDSLVWYWN